jgi:tetratricopeptide (TPR) repeat protein
MEEKNYFSNKLSNVIFLEIKKERIVQLFNVILTEDIPMPIKSERLVDRIKVSEKSDELPVSFFVEGMFYLLGIDKGFRYDQTYIKILKNVTSSVQYIKSLIFNELKKEAYEEAFIFLNGLVELEHTVDNYNKLLSIADVLRVKDKKFEAIELRIADKAKAFEENPQPYLYEAIIKREMGKYEEALEAIKAYILKGGEKTNEVLELQSSLSSVVTYEKGISLLYDEPDSALKLLLPLLDEYGDNAALYYYIAVGYRILENHEKAIYYLNDALNIDDALVEVVNELGINYASLGDFDKAIQYLRKAFEATKSIEICTNLVMCYLNSGNMEQAKNHLEIAKKIDSEDEIVLELDRIIKQ